MKLRTAVAGAVVVGVLVPAGAAGAGIKNGVCEVGEVCMHSGYQASGSTYDNDTGWDGDFSNNSYVGTATSIDNSISSVQNVSSTYVEWSTGYNFGGTHYCLPPGTSASLSYASNAHLNNQFSSNKTRSSC